MDNQKKMEAMDLLQNAINTVNAAMDSISKVADTLGIKVPEEPEGLGLEELANMVSERTGFCAHFVAEALDVAMTILEEMAEEDAEDAD